MRKLLNLAAATLFVAACANNGENWVREEWGHEISGYNHNTCYYFQSVLPGLMAAGEGEVKFSNFKYRSL